MYNNKTTFSLELGNYSQLDPCKQKKKKIKD